ncbi:hypothetical protein PG997_011062 [Apiospora hydei]|uniref:Uncharacterized protein n=1 Tax=Apiospora hydei TaxID=1337664 RepID=A0ABR1VI02_9PEZI
MSEILRDQQYWSDLNSYQEQHSDSYSLVAYRAQIVVLRMGQPSFEASNAVIYVTYGAFLVLGTGLAVKMWNQPKADFLAGNRTQTAFPLALNFIAAGE